MNHPRICRVIFTSWALLGVAVASGQTGSKPRKPTAPALAGSAKAKEPPPVATPSIAPITPAKNNPGAVELAEDPLKIESIGLTMPIPLGCVTQTDTAGHSVGARIAPKDASWVIRLSSPRAPADMTTAQVADSAIVTLLESYGITDKDAKVLGTRGRLISREPPEGSPPVLINGRQSDRWYVSLPPLEGNKPLVRGFTVIKTAPGQFITFELLTTEAEFERSRGIYQTLIAAATIEDPEKLSTDRAAVVAAGLKLFDNLGSQALKEIAAARPERWERLYRPSPTGSANDEVEIAYRRITVKPGNRSQLGQGAPAKGDREEGILVQMDARLLDGSSNIVDSRSVYFMSFDRQDEAWTVSNAFRVTGSDKKPPVFLETGARTGKSMVVRIEGTGKTPETTKPIVRDEGYISQVESALLPFLLMRQGVTIEHGFYAYQSSANTIRLRRDLLEHPADHPEWWQLTTRLSEDKPPLITYYSDKGELIRTQMPDGTIWEPTTLTELVKLWTSKGLPVD